MRVKAFALAMSLMAIPPAFCLPTDQVEKPGLTHEEWLEYLSLNTTDGWEPMTRVPLYEITEPGQVLDLADTTLYKRSLAKRAGANAFEAFEDGICSSRLFRIANFGCGVCVSVKYSFCNTCTWGSSWLWRQTNDNPYPTADWYASNDCSGSRVHHQGIESGKSFSCDTVARYGVSRYQSAMLYQGC